MAHRSNHTTDMNNLYDSNDSNDEQLHHDEETSQIPIEIDPTRPPQLNLGNTSCHCNCGCLCSSNDDDGGGQSKAVQSVVDSICNGVDGAHYASSEPGSDPINGQEGDEHMLEAGDLGPISCRTVIRALARQNQNRCACRSGPIAAGEYDTYTTYATPNDSAMMSPSESMLVDHSSSSDHSMASSQVLGIPSRDSSVYFGIGGAFASEALMERFPVLYQPLRLTPEAPVVPFEYPMTLSISAAELELGIPFDEDLW